MSAREIDAVLLLGVELRADDTPTDELLARADVAARACAAHPSAVAVVCGGVLPGHARAEADVLFELLARRGVAAARIKREDCSQNTAENMRFAARVLGGARGKRVLVVTSDYHLRRAVMTARREGFRARGMAAALPHDAAWRTLRAKELCYTLDLLMGWQDEGKGRPAWTQRAFDRVFGRRDAQR